VQPVQPAQPVPGVRPIPGQAPVQAPVMRPAPGGEAPANARGQGPTKDADDRDDRQPPGQERRKRDSNQ